ncbi:MAG: hypothetical protein MJZ22_03700 [Candidatus Saccharibacteria bacterium]|nr:hypothetical protein [Candidatus Saccharibacteria bacterium]
MPISSRTPYYRKIVIQLRFDTSSIDNHVIVLQDRDLSIRMRNIIQHIDWTFYI